MEDLGPEGSEVGTEDFAMGFFRQLQGQTVVGFGAVGLVGQDDDIGQDFAQAAEVDGAVGRQAADDEAVDPDRVADE